MKQKDIEFIDKIIDIIEDMDLCENDYHTLQNVASELSRLKNISNEVEEVYAIRNMTDGKTIWNSRGSAYKEMDDVTKKLHKLQKDYPDKQFRILTYKLGNTEIQTTEVLARPALDTSSSKPATPDAIRKLTQTLNNEHDGCVGCKYIKADEKQYPCN